MREFMRITKALADPNRVRVVLALGRGELCVCQITELLSLASSTISKHLSILHHAGLIESRKDERWVFYRLPGKQAPVVVREAVDWAKKSLGHSAEAVQDRPNRNRILKLDLKTVCRGQCKNWKYKLPCPSLVVVRQKGEKEEKWKLLGETWERVENPVKFNEYVEGEAEALLREIK